MVGKITEEELHSSLKNTINNKAEKDDIDNINSQLEQNVDYIYEISKKNSPYLYSGAVATFIDDDCTQDFISKLKPIFDSKQIKCSLGVITDNVSAQDGKYYLSLNELKQLQNEGYEILCHSKTHSSTIYRDNLDNVEDINIENDMKLAQEYMKINGLKGFDTFVYPYGNFSSNAIKMKNIARKYFNNAIDSSRNSGNYNKSPHDNMYMNRIFLSKNSGLEWHKNFVDEVYNNNGWLIFGTHAFDTANVDVTMLGQLIDYIQSKGIKILPFREALKYKGNILSIGEFTANNNKRMYIGYDSNNTINATYFEDESITFEMDRPITDFRSACLTYTAIKNSKDTLLGIGGVLETVRFYTDVYSYQIFRPFGKSIFYKRYFNNGAWKSWEIANKEFTTDSTIIRLATDSITTYIKDTIEKSYIWSSNPTISSFPESSSGELTTYRPSVGDIFAYQIYRIRQTNKTYQRYWDTSTSNWSTWEKISVI